jgi:hypothetical protein
MLSSSDEGGGRSGADFDFKLSVSGLTTPALGASPL